MIRHDTLLLAGGTPENRNMLRSVLDGRYHLLEAIGIQQALLLMEQNSSCIAAVLLDMTDPARLLTEGEDRTPLNALFQDVPVIALVEDDSQAALARAFDWGAADVIPLEYDQYAMLKRIETIVELNLHKRNLPISSAGWW